MGIKDWLQNQVQDLVWGGMETDERERFITKRRQYRNGIQAKQLKIKADNADDNIVINFVGLVVDRCVTMLFGKGIEFDMPGEGETPLSDYIDQTWDANKQQILLHKLGVLGSESGTCFVKLQEEGIRGKDGKLYTRIIPIDPKIIEVYTKPDDYEYVLAYEIEYMTKREGKEWDIRQTVTRGQADIVDQTGAVIGSQENGTWLIRDYEKLHGKKDWVLVNEVVWDYSFPPVLHWQNLPNPLEVYGVPDITEDVIRLQDRINFVASNISKIIRYHAHPQTVVIGAAKSDVQTEPGKALFLPEGANAFNLEMQSDLISSNDYMKFLMNSLFSITQTVDVSSFPDKLGALTNFGLKVLYQDALARLHTKQELYGDAIIELNRRLSVLGGFEDGGGKVIWPEILPVNEVDEINHLKSELELGIISKQSVAQELGIDWEAEQKRMADEQVAGNAENNNIGAMLLKNFTKGK
jgi:hypothetical protein